jgi:hypothetical protein
MVVWSDGDPRGTWYTGGVGDDGSMTFTFVVPLDAPNGSAYASVAASNEREGRSDYRTAALRVAGRQGCDR